jgi:hypothetical protein
MAKFDRAPERSSDHSSASRNILGDLSTGAQVKRSQRTRWSFDHSSASSAGVAARCHEFLSTALRALGVALPALTANAVEFVTVVSDLEPVLPSNGQLQGLDLGFFELDDLSAPGANEVIVVVPDVR